MLRRRPDRNAQIIELPQVANPNAKNVIKALVISADKAPQGVSQAEEDAELSSLVRTAGLLEPPLDPYALTTLWEYNSILGPCIATMAVNCEAFGYRFVPRIEITPDTPKEVLEQIEREKVLLENFFETCVIEGDESFTGLRMKKRFDLEATGYACFEVVEYGDEIVGFNHLPSYTVRMTKLGSQYVETKRRIVQRNSDGSFYLRTQTVFRRFRKFVQVIGNQKRWFKEFGDPRTLNAETGEYVKEGQSLPANKVANSILLFSLYAARSPYGLPRYVGNLLSVYGSRATDEINYFTFESNNIPSMVVTVSNGMLTEGTVHRIQEFVAQHVKGQRNYSRFLILEAEPNVEGTRDPGKVSIDIQPLTKEQARDELFTDYQKNAAQKVRESFRLPELFFGSAAQTGGAVGFAELSRKLTDEQVFQPERDLFDAKINRTILPRLGIVYHKFVTNTPQTTDNKDLVRVLAMAEKSGGVTPQIARDIMSQIVGRDLGRVTAIKGDVPFSLQIASAQKSQGDPNSVLSVPGTNALRRMGAMSSSDIAKSVAGETLLAGIEMLREQLIEERRKRHKGSQSEK